MGLRLLSRTMSKGRHTPSNRLLGVRVETHAVYLCHDLQWKNDDNQVTFRLYPPCPSNFRIVNASRQWRSRPSKAYKRQPGL